MNAIMEYKIDETYPLYLKNWQDNPDIMCRDEYELSIIPTLYTVCYSLGGIFFMIPDKIGRRLTMLFFSLVSMSA